MTQLLAIPGPRLVNKRVRTPFYADPLTERLHVRDAIFEHRVNDARISFLFKKYLKSAR